MSVATAARGDKFIINGSDELLYCDRCGNLERQYHLSGRLHSQ